MKRPESVRQQWGGWKAFGVLASSVALAADWSQAKRNSVFASDVMVSALVWIEKPLDGERRSAPRNFPAKRKQNECRAP